MATTPRRRFLKLTGIGGAGILTNMVSGREIRAQEPTRTIVSAVQTPVLSIAYEDTGAHELKGVPGNWPLFEVVSVP